VSRFQASASSAALAAALLGVALGARGGSQLERTVTVELLLTAAGAAAICAAILFAPRRRVHGAWAVAGFAALAMVTALSIGWSIAPSLSYVETGRTLAYLAVFSGAVAAARLAPGAAPVVVRGLLLATVAVAAYGLIARVWPASFDEGALVGRIALPFDYWNALAGTAAMGIVPALWLGARRTGTPLGRALAYPAVGLLIATVLIAQSRGALFGAALACALWIAIVPLRLRSLAVLAIGGGGAVPVVTWALSKEPFRLGGQSLAAREAVAGDFGLLLLATVGGLLAAGFAVVAIQARRRPSVRARVRSGLAAGAVAALVPLALLTSVALSDRGLVGAVSDRADQITSETEVPPMGGARLSSASSSRATYWRQAWHAFEERPLVGLGANSFALSRLAYRGNGAEVGHAHGFFVQTLGDLGLLGLAAVLALLAAWLAAAALSTAVGPRRWVARATPWTSERMALVALALAAVTYGVQATADWTWFVPAITTMALVAAGFVAGRGPLAPRGTVPAPGARRPRPAPAAAIGAAGAAGVALLFAWVIWQPVAADRAVARSYDLLDEGRPAAALREAESAHDHNPYSNEPLYAGAAALADLGRRAAALRALRRAAADHPRDPDPLVQIASFELYRLGDPQAAIETIDAADRLDPHSPTLAAIRQQAVSELQRSPSRGGATASVPTP
jgi:O-antigen ligase